MKFIFILGLVTLASLNGRGQDPANNIGSLQLHSGANWVAFGAFTNSSSATLTNNANLSVKGSLTNDQASMTAGAGTLSLIGIIAQTVNGSQVFKTNNLVTDNSAGITLNNDLSVAGVHTFTNGLIASSATPNYLVYESGSSYSGASDSRHITGWATKNGNTAFTFPVGNNTYLRSIALSNLSAVSSFNARYLQSTQNIYNLTSPVVEVRPAEYWQLDKISGGTGMVTLNWDHSKVAMDNILLQDILVARYSGASWIDAGGAGTATGVVATTGTITSTAQSTFGQVTLGYKSFPVPLRMISFTGERRNGVSYLHWITDNEQNVRHFEVQRSYDAVHYSTIGTVAARNTGVRDAYSFADNSVLNGYAWYRLLTVDMDGQKNYSRIVVVSEATSAMGSFLVINPAVGVLTIFNKTGRNEDLNYRLFNAAGKMVAQGEISFIANSGAVIDLPFTISTGIYTLELNNERSRFRQQVLIQK